MAKGKQTCKILKEIRKQIAAENDIKLVIEECTYQGDCKGTCPKCEAEVRYLERELEKRQRMGKAAIFAGMTIGTAITAAGCGPLVQPNAGMPMDPNDTVVATDTLKNDSVDEPYLLEGDVVAPEPDTIETKKKACLTQDEPLEIVGEIEEDYVTPGLVELGLDEYVATEVQGEVESPENEIYQIVEEMPSFPEGEEKLLEFLQKNTRYPDEAIEAGAYGRVFVGCVIEKDGSIGEVRLLRGIGYGCDEEAIRVVKSMPKWNPGKHRGEPVRVSYQIPILFKLQGSEE